MIDEVRLRSSDGATAYVNTSINITEIGPTTITMFGDIGGPLNWPGGVSFRIYLRDNDVGRPFTYTVNIV